MKKVITILSILLGFQNIGIAQNSKLEKIWHELAISTQDTTHVNLLLGLCDEYKLARPDSAIFYGHKAVILSNRINYTKGEVEAMIYIILAHIAIGNDAKALEIILQAIKIAEKSNMNTEKANLYSLLGRIYRQSYNYEKALSLYRQSMIIMDSVHEYHYSAMVRSDIGEIYLLMDNLDSAQYFTQLSYNLAVEHKDLKIQYYSLPILGKIQHLKGNDSLALIYYMKGLELDVENYLSFNPNLAIAQIYQQIGQPDSSLFYANQSLDIAFENGFYLSVIDASDFISKFYEKADPAEALKYAKMSATYKDSLYHLGKLTALENFTDFDEQERQNEIEKAKIEYRNKVQKLWIFSITGALLSALLVSLILFRNSKNKQKANKILAQTLSNLKSTQSQLIQSEKMASLGELTAGIAHEIQNPLNFVNNFSDVSEELVAELQEEINKGDLQEAKLISDDVIQNLQKIKHHGLRASEIVKGMLQHSRTSTGQKELTDINTLADEYLRLAYHGLLAKDNAFNAEFKTNLDPSIPKLNVITQDIGRVLLNLINNAFYAVDKKAKEGIDGYKPIVIVTTKKNGKSIEIRVKDNGDGISVEIKDKIFQPFFTTKPTGSGTGLGLSLSYDIVKAHGWEIELLSAEGKDLPAREAGSEFKITIPNT